MQRLTISIPTELLDQACLLAAKEGTTVAGFIREAIEDKLAELVPDSDTPDDPESSVSKLAPPHSTPSE